MILAAVGDRAQDARRRSTGPPRTALGTVACLLAVGMVFLDTTIVNVAFPSIGECFPDADLATLSWVLNAYAVLFAALLLPLGRIADLVGRRRVFIVGLVTFIASSAACGLAPSAEALIAARGVQAIGAAAMVPASLALMLDRVTAERRSVAVGVWSAAAGTAGALGPLAGGVLVEAADWRLAFIVNIPLGVLALAGAKLGIEARRPQRGAFPDIVGSVLLTSAAGLAALGLVEGNNWGWLDARLFGCAAGTLLLGAWAVSRSRRHPAPAIRLDLFRLSGVRTAAMAMLLFGAAFYGLILACVLFLSTIWEYSVLETGLAIAPAPMIAAGTAIITGRRAVARGHRQFAFAGTTLYAVSCGWIVLQTSANAGYVQDFLPAFAVAGVGVGLTMPSLAAAGVAAPPPDRFGLGTAVNMTARQLGAMLGVAVLVAVIGAPASLASLHDGILVMGALSLAAAAASLLLPSAGGVLAPLGKDSLTRREGARP